MVDYLDLGCTPYEEPCAQVGHTPGFRTIATAECHAFIAQLVRLHGQPPDGTQFRIKWNDHDFGSYPDVRIYFEEDNQAAVDYAYAIEAGIPAEWDDTARAELKAKGALVR